MRDTSLRGNLLRLLRREPSKFDAFFAHMAIAAGIAGICGHFGHMHQNVPWLPTLFFVFSFMWHGYGRNGAPPLPKPEVIVSHMVFVAVGGGFIIAKSAEGERVGALLSAFVFAFLFAGVNTCASLLHETIQRFARKRPFSEADMRSRNAATFGVAISLISSFVTRTSLYRASLNAAPGRFYDLWPLLGLLVGAVAIFRTQRRLSLRDRWLRDAKEGKIPGIRLEERVEVGERVRIAVVAHDTENAGAYREALHEEELFVWHEEPRKDRTRRVGA